MIGYHGVPKAESLDIAGEANGIVQKLEDLKLLAEPSGALPSTLYLNMLDGPIDHLRTLVSELDENIQDSNSVFQYTFLALDGAIKRAKLLIQQRSKRSKFLHRKETKRNWDRDLVLQFIDLESLTASLLPHARGISTSQAQANVELNERIDQAEDRQRHRTSQNEVEIENEIETQIANLHLVDGEPGRVNFADFSCIWNQVPWPQNMPQNPRRTYNAKDNGVVFLPDDVQETDRFLSRFRRSWEVKSRGVELNPPPEQLHRLNLICLILQSLQMDGRQLSLLIQGGWNFKLPFEPDFLETIFTAGEAKKLQYQQYCAVQRHWPEFNPKQVHVKWYPDHYDFGDGETLPLVFDKELQPGSYGKVEVVMDSWDRRKRYVKKYNDLDFAIEALKKEREILQKLDHRHIVRCVKSFAREGYWGILLRPVAQGNLLELLNEYHYYFSDDVEQQQYLRPQILRMYGCLSHGLHYMRQKEIRHRDIKPENVVYRKDHNGVYQFQWIDFGVSHDFSQAASSATYSQDLISRRYAAPEYQGESYGLQADPVNKPDHDYHSDIFSFGIVFLEVLSVLVGEGLRGKKEGPFQKCVSNKDDDVRFADHIDDVERWVEDRVSEINANGADKDLTGLFTLGGKMIQHDYQKRPTVDTICKDLTSSKYNSAFFCYECAADLQLSSEPDPIKKQEGQSKPKMNWGTVTNPKTHNTKDLTEKLS